MTVKELTESLKDNIDKIMKEDLKIKRWIKLLEALAFNIYKHVGHPKGDRTFSDKLWRNKTFTGKVGIKFTQPQS